MASPYDSAIDMFNLPRYGTGGASFPRREDPMTSARRRFLEGGQTAQPQEDFIAQRAQETEDPFGVMQEVENLRREREEEGFLSDIAALNPAKPDYRTSMMDLVQRNPRIASSKSAMGLLNFQQNFMPKQQVDKFAAEAAGFGAPVYQAYRRARSSGKDEMASYADAMTERARLESINKAATMKPWSDRLSDKEAQAVRGAAGEARQLSDFESEFASVQKDNPSLTREEYVKKYKGDASYADYKARRLMESATGLMQDYGLTAKEASSVLGLSQNNPIGGPWQDRTTVGPQVIPATSETIREKVTPIGVTESVSEKTTNLPVSAVVSPADLQRVSQDEFSRFQQEISSNKASESADERAKREKDFVEKQAKDAKDNELWEASKQQALKNLSAQDLRNLLTGGGMTNEGELRTVVQRATGKKYNEEAFTDASGRPRAWIEVFRALAADPRTKALFMNPSEGSPKTIPATAPKVDRSSLWNSPKTLANQ